MNAVAMMIAAGVNFARIIDAVRLDAVLNAIRQMIALLMRNVIVDREDAVRSVGMVVKMKVTYEVAMVALGMRSVIIKQEGAARGTLLDRRINRRINPHRSNPALPRKLGNDSSSINTSHAHTIHTH